VDDDLSDNAREVVPDLDVGYRKRLLDGLDCGSRNLIASSIMETILEKRGPVIVRCTG